MNKNTSILFIQHADTLGGSAISLREVVQDALSKGYNCTIICKNNTVAKIYESLGATCYIRTIATVNHNTALSYKLTPIDILRLIKALLRTLMTIPGFHKLVKQLRPDIVHLNSSNLILYTVFFRILRMPVVFHVREVIVKGYWGFRKSLIRNIANRFATAIIYISESEFEILNTLRNKSFVIYNYVHSETFESTDTASNIFNELGKLRVITLGGLYRLKGGLTILQALSKSTNTELMVLGCDDPRENSNEIMGKDGKAYTENILGLLQQDSVASRIMFAGKVDHPAPYIKAADCVLFWADLPHFPRPVFEAWLLKKPVIYFNPLFRNDKITRDNVFMIGTGDAGELSKAFYDIRRSNLFAMEQLNAAYALARGNFTETNFEEIDKIYQLCLEHSKLLS